jgi:NhaP-type Na+/H+ or K+/H+ antiporter
MVLGGILGGVAGGVTGYYLSSSSDDLGTAYTSTALGTLAGIPVGVHVGNSARGNGPLTVLAGFGQEWQRC